MDPDQNGLVGPGVAEDQGQVHRARGQVQEVKGLPRWPMTAGTCDRLTVGS